jgi:hypothetical protein
MYPGREDRENARAEDDEEHRLERKYSWCYVPEIVSAGFFLGEETCQPVACITVTYFCSIWAPLAGSRGNHS